MLFVTLFSEIFSSILILLQSTENLWCYSNCTEAATAGVFLKKVSLEILQNSQENTCARVSFLLKKKINFIKKETLAQVLSCKFCKISKNTFSENTSRRLLLTVVRDISNAFYSAWHTGLLYKFRLYGVRCFIFMSHPVVVKKF